MAEVVLRQVSKRFPDGTEVLKALDLDLGDGQLVVLVGPSGCGKSTTLRLVAGLEELSGGSVTVDGRRVDHLPPRDRDVAMVFQSYALYPQMTVYENMAFALTLRKLPHKEIQQRVDRAAQVLGLVPLLHRYPRQLSGGQRQRVALGRAMVREPKCFLFDEPLSNLDAKLRGETRAEIKRLHRELGTTTLYVTHDQEEAMTLSDRLVVMDGGVVRQSGPPLDLYHRPADRFVAGFLGTPAMSFLDGELHAAEGRVWFIHGDDRVVLGAPSGVDQWLNKKVVLGMRPTAFNADRSATRSSAGTLRGRVILTEPLGARMNVHLETAAGAKLVLEQEAAATVCVGDWQHGTLNMQAVHVFEPGRAGRAIPFAV